MSQWIRNIMEKYEVDAQKAIEIIERESAIISFIHDYTNPYGKHCN